MSEAGYITELRTEFRRKPARKGRAQGRVPVVLYGAGLDNQNLWLKVDDAGKIVDEKRRVLELSVEGKAVQALVREVQYDTLGEKVLHLDFQRLRKGEKIEVRIPVMLKGEPIGLKEGGVLEHYLQTVVLMADPVALPRQLEVDVSGLHLGDNVAATSLALPPEAELLGDTGATVVAVTAPREE
ncbi:MAG: 50S ribosomal protein L25, partial [Planctomycetota bacterium]